MTFTHLSTQRVYRLGPILLGNPMIDNDAIVLQEAGKEQVDFGPAVTLNEIVNDFAVEVILQGRLVHRKVEMACTYLVCRHEIAEILFR